MRFKRAGKVRRVLTFLCFVAMLGGLHAFGAVLHRPIPLWFSLGWLGLFGWMCWLGWEDDDDAPPPHSARSPRLQRLGYGFALLGGLGLCWLGWLGWTTRGDGSMAGLLVFLAPIGLLWLLWLLGRLMVSWLSGR